MRSNGTFNDLLRLYDLLLTNIEYFILFLNYYRVAIKLPDVKEAKIFNTEISNIEYSDSDDILSNTEIKLEYLSSTIIY